MSSRHPRSVIKGIAYALVLMVTATQSAFAATEMVEILDPYAGERGKLRPLNRQLAPEIDPASNEGQLALGRMQLPPGLKATLWAAEPMFANPVAFNFDEKGRIFVSETHRYGSSVLDIRDYMWLLEDDLSNRTQDDFKAMVRRDFGEANEKELAKESERLVVLEDTNGDGVADKSSVFAEDFRTPISGIASGVLARRGDVWFSSIPALWKFTGKDKAEKRTALLEGFGLRFNFTGHDFHGLIFGPDGRIYMSIGDRAATVKTKEGTTVATPDTGSVFRCWPDGTGFELYATGLRNPQSLLFNEYGDLFTGDNDSDQGDQERLFHVVEGADHGWRIGYQFAPRGNAGPWNAERMWQPRNSSQAAYFLAAICNIEDGPSGIAYYPGTGLTPDYAQTIFITHFKGAISSSGIFTYKLKPDGASWAIDKAAPFLTGALPTDVRFGPDGKFYYSDWAEGWPKSRRGRIYAIFDPNRVNDPVIKETQKLIAADTTKKSDDELATLLRYPDWRVRLEAQYTLAERGEPAIAKFVAAANSDSEAARRHAVWGLGQVARNKQPKAVAALRALLAHNDGEVRAQAANTLGDLRDRDSGDALVKLLSDSAPRAQFFAAIALGKIKHAAATPALLAALRANNDKDAYLRHAFVMGLVGCAKPADLVATAKDASPAVRLAAVVALRRLENVGVTNFLADENRAVVFEAVEAINDQAIPAGYPALAAFLAKPVDSEPIMLRALNAAFRAGGADQAAALATFAAGESSAVLRSEALALLALWPEPPARDRIVGVFRPLPDKTRATTAVATALLPKLEGIFAAHTPDKVQQAALDAVVKLKLTDALPVVRAVVTDASESISVRLAAFKALDALHDPELAATAATVGKSDTPELRLAALPVSSRLDPAGAVPRLTDLLARGTPKEQQMAFRALVEVKDPAADELFLAQLKRFSDGQVPPAAQLDLLDAAAKRTDPRIKQIIGDRDAALAKDPDPLAPFRVTLEGGEPKHGMDIFYRNPVMQCIRCHRVGESGSGDAGPNLGGIATRESKEYILQSIIKPSARIAPGFEIVTVTRRAGEPVVGTLVSRDDKGLKLKTGDSELTIPAADVAKVESAPSAMPELAAMVLTKAEIRDLVAAVSNFTTPPPKFARDRKLRALQHLEGKPIEPESDDEN